MTGADQSNPPPGPARCVLWHAAGVEPPDDLLRSLDRRQVVLVRCTSPYRAIAEVCRLARPANPGAPIDSLILLLVTPGALDQAATVAGAAKRYAPHAACWWYDDHASPKLRDATDEDIASWSNPVVPIAASAPAPDAPRPARNGAAGPLHPTPPRAAPAYPAPGVGGPGAESASAPRLRLSGHTGSPLGPDPRIHAAQPPFASPTAQRTEEEPGSLLTEEELAMLLSDDFAPSIAPAWGPSQLKDRAT